MERMEAMRRQERENNKDKTGRGKQETAAWREESEMGGVERILQRKVSATENEVQREALQRHRKGIKGIYSCRQSLYHLSYLEAPKTETPELTIEEETTLY